MVAAQQWQRPPQSHAASLCHPTTFNQGSPTKSCVQRTQIAHRNEAAGLTQRIDISIPVVLSGKHLLLPKQSHLEQLCTIINVPVQQQVRDKRDMKVQTTADYSDQHAV